MTVWTRAREVKLTILYPCHKTSEIVKMEGFEGFTKAAIIGKANRLGLRAPQRATGGGRLPAKPKVLPRPTHAPFIAFKDVSKGCRYPREDADGKEGGKMMVCGQPTLEGKSNCQYHQEKSTEKRKRRRK